MSKWSPFTLFLCASVLSSTLFGQWTPAGGQYPSTQYPQQQQQQSAQYPQTQYPEAQYPQNQYPQNGPQQSQYPPLQSQQQSAQQQGGENPDPADLQHGAARVSIAQGDVNIRRGDNGQYTGAVVNAPVVAKDHVETSGGSRAEIQLDAVTMVRLAPNTDVGFADLQYHRAQIQLGLGTITFRVLQASPTQVEIDTPSVGFRALSPGEYRISVFDNGTSQISVRNGQGEVLAPRGSERLEAGRSVMVRGDAANPEMQDAADIPRDQFDDWSDGRDQELAASQSTQYVNTDVQGASDLDRYGSWVPSPDYGQVWQPQGVAQDWSPYSNGQWAYTDYYGWSWIDASPWGWAPYHYGRWFHNGDRGWCWWPGSRLQAAYYSPALVGFYGLGRGIALGLEGLAWVALAPFEIFHPWWGVHGGFGAGGYGFRGGYAFVGYRNAGFRGGVRTASVNGFAGVRQRFGVASRSQILGATAISGRLPLNNVRAGMNYSNRAVVPNARFNSVQSRSFFNGGQNHSFNSPATNNSYRGFGARTTTPAAGGWQHFGAPGASASHSNFQSSEPGGWHTFGKPSVNGGNSYSGNSYRATPRPAAPSYQQPRYNNPAPRSYSQPSYNNSAPRSYSQPSYQQQQQRPQGNYSAPHQNAQPRTSAPSAPHSSSGGGGGGHASSGGGGHSSGGGGGGHHGR